MNKKILSLFVVLAGVIAAAPAFAAEADAAYAGATSYFIAVVVTAGFALMGASMFGALGQGKAIAAALEGIARQPSASGKIQLNLIIGLALIESLVIYVLVVSLLLFFADPFSSFFLG